MVAALFSGLLLGLAAPAAAQKASGKFVSSKIELPIVGAYSYWGKAGDDEGDTIKVAVSNVGFVTEAMDDWYDRQHVIHELFVDDETFVVTFEFDAKGKYRGYSFYFGSGDGCGYCYSSKVKSSVKASNGRLKGKISQKESPSFEIEFDVRIPDKLWGEPLPRDGGDPGKAFLAYHRALTAENVRTLKTVSDTWFKNILEKHEKDKDIAKYIDYRLDDRHMHMKAPTITGGFVKGDKAVVLFNSSSTMFDNLFGEATLTREGGVWLVHDELIQIGKR